MSVFDPLCRACGRVLDRKSHESLEHYRARRRCEGDGCAGASVPRFPRAIHAAQLPPTCLRCGGLYRWIGDGVACYVCPWHQVVVEALTALVARGSPMPVEPIRLGSRPKRHAS